MKKTAIAQLADLLSSGFTGPDLNQFILTKWGASEANGVPFYVGLSMTTYAFEVAGRWGRMGYIDENLFRDLMEARPNDRQAIREVAQAVQAEAREPVKSRIGAWLERPVEPDVPVPVVATTHEPRVEPPPTDEPLFLDIVHEPAIPGFAFRVEYGGESAPTVFLTDPRSGTVKGLPEEKHLLDAVAWYLEEYPKAPASPRAQYAKCILAAMEKWGETVFRELFGAPPASSWQYDLAQKHRSAGTRWVLRVRSGDPKVLEWPWEAVQDGPNADPVSLRAGVERALTTVPEPHPLMPPGDRLSVLVVTSRPLTPDAPFRAVTAPLLNALQDQPVDITLLRPPTFKQLREWLRQHPGRHHVLHFDGHGCVRHDGSSYLLFENEAGEEDRVATATVCGALEDARIPAVVLTACRSASQTGATSAFSSVTTSLLRAGVATVVAMAYDLRVDAAGLFVPAFYRGLLHGGSFGRAVSDGRRDLDGVRTRASESGGRVSLRDYLVPVLYQNRARPLAVSEHASGPRLPRRPRRFYGRDNTILRLERVIRSDHRGILVWGEEALGKSTLVHEFAEWLARTGWGGDATVVPIADSMQFSDVLDRIEKTQNVSFAGLSDDERVSALARLKLPRATLVILDGLVRIPSSWEALPRLMEELEGGLRIMLTTRYAGLVGTAVQVKLLPFSQAESEDAVRRILGNLRVDKVTPADPEVRKLLRTIAGRPLPLTKLVPYLQYFEAEKLTELLWEFAAQLQERKIWKAIDDIEARLKQRLTA